MPANDTARKNACKDPVSAIAVAQIAVRPAAGPLTLKGDLLIAETTMPPIIPESNPDNNGAPEASEIPRHKGSATKKTVILALRSCFRKEEK